MVQYAKAKRGVFMKKRTWVIGAIVLFLLIGLFGSSDETEEVADSQDEVPAVEVATQETGPEEKPKPKKEPTEKEKIDKAIRGRVGDGDYRGVKLNKVTVNDNLGIDEDGYYIALVYLTFEVKNFEKTANKMMRKYSDDLVATLANKGFTNISEAAVFWEDEYNNRNLKYAYYFRDGSFYVMDTAGE